jgi:hypothetical protein
MEEQLKEIKSDHFMKNETDDGTHFYCISYNKHSFFIEDYGDFKTLVIYNDGTQILTHSSYDNEEILEKIKKYGK